MPRPRIIDHKVDSKLRAITTNFGLFKIAPFPRLAAATCQKRFSGRHETILWFTKTENYTFNLDPVRVPSKYPEKKHFKGPQKRNYFGKSVRKESCKV